MEANNFTHQALGAVSFDGTANFFRRHEAIPFRAFQDVHYDMLSREALTVSEYVLKIGIANQAVFLLQHTSDALPPYIDQVTVLV